MEDSSPAAKKRALSPGAPAMASSSDRITPLPDEVAHEILARVPIRDAVRTAALSRAWRDRWRSMPSLAFDDRSLLRGRLRSHRRQPQGRQRWAELARAADHVLTLHAGGHLRLFSISSTQPAGPELFRWVAHLRGRRVERLHLAFTGGAPQELPPGIFLCGSLETLVLRNCSLRLPPCVGSLHSIRRLALQSACATEGELQRLLERLPGLEALALDAVQVGDRLCIRAPRLVALSIVRMGADLSLEDAGRLTWASIGVCPSTEEDNMCNLPQLLSGLPNVATLRIVDKSLQALAAAASEVPAETALPRAYIRLTSLHLDIDFTSGTEILASFYLLRSSPNLQKLTITARTCADASIPCGVACPKQQGLSFRRLREVEVREIAGSRMEFLIVQSILAASPALRRMNVSMASSSKAADRLTVSSWLLQFRRASPQAEVFFDGAAKS